MAYPRFRILLSTTCMASLLFAASALAQEAPPPPMPPVPPLPEAPKIPDSVVVPVVPAPSQATDVPAPEFDNFEDTFAPKEEAPAAPAEAAAPASEEAAAPVSDASEAEIDALLKEMSAPSVEEQKEEKPTEPVVEKPAEAIDPAPVPAEAPAAEATPGAPAAPEAPKEEAVAETPEVPALPEPAPVAEPAAEEAPAEEAATPPPPALPAAEKEEEKEAEDMSVEERDAEIKTMLDEIKETGDLPAPEVIKEAPVAKPVRVPDFLYNKQQSKENRHLAPVYTAAELDRLLLKEASAGNVNGVQAILNEGRDANLRAEGGVTPLIAAVRAGAKDTARLLLMRGADAGFADDEGRTPLHFAAARGDITVMGALLDAGADVNAADKSGTTPLEVATASGEAEAARLLLLKGASPDLANQAGETPLHVAAERNDAKLTDILLKAKADPTATTASGLTPSAIAAKKGFTQLAAKIEKGAEGYTPAQPDIMMAKQDASGALVWAQPAPAPVPVIEVEDVRHPSTLKPGKWYRDKENWKSVWFKFKGARPQKGESTHAEEGWKYSQDSDGRWWVFDGVHVTYAKLPEEEQKRWNGMLNDWIEANADFDRLSPDQKKEWGEKLSVLRLVFAGHFTGQTPEDKAYLKGVLAKWEALEPKPVEPAVPEEAIEVAEAPDITATPDQQPVGVPAPQPAPGAQPAPGVVPATPTPATPVEVAAVAVPKSMQKPGEQSAPAKAETPASPVKVPEAPATAAASPAVPAASGAPVTPPPPLPDLPAPTASKQEVAKASEAAQAQLDALQGKASTKDIAKKVAEQAALSGAKVTPETEKQLEVLQMVGEWETIDEARANLAPAQREEAETRRQQIAAKMAKGGSHEHAFASMPEPLQQQFKDSMKVWNAAATTGAPLPDYYSKEAGKKPVAPAAPVPLAVVPAKPEEELPQSIRWARAHPEIVPLWLSFFADTPVAPAKPVAETPMSAPIPAPEPAPVPPYVLEAQQTPIPAPKPVETPVPEAPLAPLDPRTATPEQVQEMIRATEELKRVIRALEALKGLLEPQQ